MPAQKLHHASATVPKHNARYALIIRIQDSSDGLCIFSFTHGTIVVTGVERLEIKTSLRLSAPESNVVCVDGVIAWDRHVVRYGKYLDASLPAVVARRIALGVAVQADADGIVETGCECTLDAGNSVG